MQVRSLLILLVAGLFALSAHAKDPVYTQWHNNLALDGYDAVAYFTENAPLKGHKDYAYDWNGAEWRFSSAANLAAFQSSPEAYAPQYGGYCAWAVGEGEGSLVRGDPKQFSIIDGKLYVNYNQAVKEKWLQNPRENIDSANENWVNFW